MEHLFLHLWAHLASHPGWTLTIVFLAAFLEAVAVVGTFVPGSTVIFLAGALAGAGSLNLAAVLACAVVGAVAGDGLSYWLGARFREQMPMVWPFRRHPQLLEKGQDFLSRHGAKSILLARFVGPIRAVVPVVAGMLGMSAGRFYLLNVVSALLWAPAHIVPGAVFGASVQLAGAVSFRLVVVIVLLVGISWLGYRLARLLFLHAGSLVDEAGESLTRWASRHPGRAGRLARRILDPAEPGARITVAMSAVVLGAGGVFLAVMQDVLQGDPLVHVDGAVYRFLASVRTPWSDAAFAGIAMLGSVVTLGALVAVVALLLAWETRWRALGYWLAAAAFSQAVILVVRLAIHRAAPAAAGAQAYAFPSDHVAASVIVYGFLAFLFARRARGATRAVAVTASIVIVVLIALAGLYLGRFWFSDAIAGAALACAWLVALALELTWRNPMPPKLPPLYPVAVFGAMAGAVGLQFAAGGGSPGKPALPATEGLARPTIVISQRTWTDTAWRRLPCWRTDLEGDRKEPLSLQWSASAAGIETALRAQGWLPGVQLSARTIFSLVAPNVSAMALPVLPKLDNGAPSPLVFARAGDVSAERFVLRLWPAGYAVADPKSGAPVPLWTGMVVRERLLRPAWPVNVLRVERHGATVDANSAPAGTPAAAPDVAVIGRRSCDGVTVTLLASVSR
ncbi:VTT domain-containing protein [Paraburkholderia kururiensis]|uniref:VTT domain-containing protein n=1 Tax=Paraburkholderia kururiensis TaxID=984307 RepID=A0ABZ0WFB3_9BURK|nr:VTT domain-containing protein [Paraburkholderia kururiensis]WQD76031.1 VTT domain-containing protein [Paraburkholderia kururiensis]